MGVKLTPTEGKVLIELIRNQVGPDKRIARKLNMAPSNFAAIKRRLEEKGVLINQIRINVHVIPQFKVGAFVWLEYNKPVREEFTKELDEIRMHFPHAFTFGSSDWSLNVSYYGSFAESEDARLEMMERLHRSRLRSFVSNHMWKTVPLNHMTICGFAKRLVRYTVKHEKEKPSQEDCTFGETKKVRLTASEKRVLVGMRKYWKLKKSDIAKKVGIKQSSLSEVFKSLLKKGVISYTRTVEMKNLPGRDIATFAWVELRQPFIERDWNRMIRSVVEKTPQIAKIHQTRTFLMVESYFHSLEKAESAHLMMLELFGDNLKTFNFKIVPCHHLQTIYTPYFLERAFGVSL